MCELQLAKQEHRYWTEVLRTTSNRLIKRIAESNLKSARKLLRSHYANF